VFVALFTGCSQESDKKEKAKVESTSNLQNIEVIENKNALEIKVAEKQHDTNQSKSYYYDYNIKSGYDLNAMPANEDASVRAKPRTVLDANIYIRSPYEDVEVSMLVKRLSKEFIVKCSACHNDYANGVIGPSLLGKNSEYIFNKIAEFKKDSSKNVLMNGLISQMDDEEIRRLSDEIYEFNKMINEMRR
jgi:cytochrome c553